MGFLTGLFGGETNIWTILFALIIVTVLIIIGVWALKLIFKASATIAGGRKRRLALVDTMALDNKRNLILVRRDDVEHLIMVSNTGELLIEASIPSPQAKTVQKTAKQTQNTNIQQSSSEAPEIPKLVAVNQGTSPENQPLKSNIQKSSADRLGLSRLLRRDPKIEPAPGPSPISPAAAATIAAATPIATIPAANAQTVVTTTPKPAPIPGSNIVTPLRTSGILKPISELVSANLDDSQKNPSSSQNVSSNEFDSSSLNDTSAGKSPFGQSPVNDDAEADKALIADAPPKEAGDEEIPSEDKPAKNNSLDNAVLNRDASDTKPLGSQKSGGASTDTSNDQPKTDNSANSDRADEQDVSDDRVASDETEEVKSLDEEIIKPSNPDSAKNEVQQIDAKAMESIEEGAISGNDGAKSGKESAKSAKSKDPQSTGGAKTAKKNS